ncbi:MAG: cytochrome c peroxidase [Spirosomataceae bacterium]
MNRAKTIFLVFVSASVLVALTSWNQSIETGEYPLVYPANFGSRYSIPADNPVTKEGVHLGRLLFYETRLSANNKVSCGSCHQQQLAFTDGQKFSHGISQNTTTRNTMSLANLLWVRNLFWDGRAASLEAQCEAPLTHPDEMGQPLAISCQKLAQTSLYPPLFKLVYGSDEITPDKMVKAIAQFERTLISANSPYDAYLSGKYSPTPQELNGLKLFSTAPQPDKNTRGANCAHCHGGAKTMVELFHNNGLDGVSKDIGRQAITQSETDHGRFRVPTLRNIALTAPYMHDGRFATLAEVLDHYSEHLVQSSHLSPFLNDVSNVRNGKSLLLTAQEKADIIAFLHLLTDTTFIHNPAFSNPHQTH